MIEKPFVNIDGKDHPVQALCFDSKGNLLYVEPKDGPTLYPPSFCEEDWHSIETNPLHYVYYRKVVVYFAKSPVST